MSADEAPNPALTDGDEEMNATKPLDESSRPESLKETESDNNDENDDQEDVDQEEIAEKPENTDSYNGFATGGRSITLQMLLAAKILEPGESTMTIEYLGQKFVGDLLADGKIKSQECETVFCSPSAWATYCKRIINPDKKSNCGWASIKYKGKKLDAYKTIWMKKKCQSQKDSIPSDDEPDDEGKENDVPERVHNVVQYSTINRNTLHDVNTLIETSSFQSINKIQPFLVSVTISSMLVMDFHCHLTKSEVCGYLGGTWDFNTHTLAVSHAFPCRNSKRDRYKANDVEIDIQKAMLEQNLTLVGWYHSHPRFGAQPTLRDCDSQLDYQIKMRGTSDATYSPCIGFICSPYCEDNHSMESNITSFWILPPPDNRIHDFGRPMFMNYSIAAEVKEFSLALLKAEMKKTVEYYEKFEDIVNFKENYNAETSYIEKLKSSLYAKFPRAYEKELDFWNWVRDLFGLEPETEFTIPKNAFPIVSEIKPEVIDVKLENGDKSDKPGMLSLQEQLNMPCGLNMNPSPLSTGTPAKVTPTPPANNGTLETTTVQSSPRDSPITIPSNVPSPAKVETTSIRATPSPARSDASSSKTNRINSTPSPSPSLSKMTDMPKIDPLSYSFNQSNINDLIAMNLATLSGKIPDEYLALLQQTKPPPPIVEEKPKRGRTSSQNSTSSTSSSNFMNQLGSGFNIKDLVKQLSKPMEQSTTKSVPQSRTNPIGIPGNDKIGDFLNSQEYASLLLQQAEILNATTLGMYNPMLDLHQTPILPPPTKKSKKSNAQNNSDLSKMAAYLPPPGMGASPFDIASFLQEQISSTAKQSAELLMQQSSNQNNSKISEQIPPGLTPETLSHLFSPILNTKKKESKAQSSAMKQTDDFLYQQNKISEKTIKEMAALYSQYGIPQFTSLGGQGNDNLNDPAAWLSKIQQETLNALMMKPPKVGGDIIPPNTLQTNNKKLDNYAPYYEPKKQPETTVTSKMATKPNPKYNFSAADLAVSSVNLSEKKDMVTIDNIEPLAALKPEIKPPIKKRMEFSSIPELAASLVSSSSAATIDPITKPSEKKEESSEILNLSTYSND